MDLRSLIPFGRSGLGEAQDTFLRMRQDMDRMLEDFTRSWPAAPERNGFLSPKVNIAETDAGLEVTAELPGIDEKEIELDIANGVLTLKAEHKEEIERSDEAKRWHLVERRSGTYLRRFALPFEADEDKVQATFEKGVLKIVVPRSAAAAPTSKKITVNAGH